MATTTPDTDTDTETSDGRWRVEGRTTIVLRRNERGSWLATQPGVDAEGYGPTAPAAVAAYGRQLDGE